MNTIKTSIIALAVLAAALTASAGIATDPATGKLYLVSEKTMTWAEANSFAEATGGHLLSINSQAEENTVRTLFGRTELFWIGLDPYQGAYVLWQTGEPLSWSYWGAGYSVPIFGDAVVMNFPNSQGFTRGEWGQIPRTDRVRAIVEFEIPQQIQKAGPKPFRRRK